jgi:phosphoglycolate phosphatase-like HAD superfamily hydrolase
MSRPHLRQDDRLFDFIVFDLDGTLVDSLQDLCDSANLLVAEYGGVPLDTSQIARMVGEGASVLVDRVVAASGIAEEPAIALARFLAIYGGRLLNNTRPYPGIPEFVREMSEEVPAWRGTSVRSPAATARARRSPIRRGFSA